MNALFAPGALVAELRGDAEPAALYPEEAVYVQAAAPLRVQEFAAGRLCARRLLREFGIEYFPIRVGENRQPIWPEGLVGSITHTAGFCAAVAAPKAALLGVGIDTEMAGSVRTELWRHICTAAEIAWLRSLPDVEQAPAATLIFCAKEAFYKCQYPVTQERLGFGDATIEVPTWGSHRGSVLIHANKLMAFARSAALPLRGGYLFHEQFVTAAVAVASPAL